MQSKHQLTEFGKRVVKRQIDTGLSQKELAEQVANATGKYMDATYLRKIITGQRNSDEAICALKKILNL